MQKSKEIDSTADFILRSKSKLLSFMGEVGLQLPSDLSLSCTSLAEFCEKFSVKKTISEADQLPISLPIDFFPDPGVSITIDPSITGQILQQFRSPDSTLPAINSSDDYLSQYTPDERNALYDYAVEHTTRIQVPPELFMDPEEKKVTEDDPLAEETYEQRIIRFQKERDLKRRRQAYRRKVSTKNKAYIEVAREIISNFMEAISDQTKDGLSDDTAKLASNSLNINDDLTASKLPERDYRTDRRKEENRRPRNERKCSSNSSDRKSSYKGRYGQMSRHEGFQCLVREPNETDRKRVPGDDIDRDDHSNKSERGNSYDRRRDSYHHKLVETRHPEHRESRHHEHRESRHHEHRESRHHEHRESGHHEHRESRHNEHIGSRDHDRRKLHSSGRTDSDEDNKNCQLESYKDKSSSKHKRRRSKDSQRSKHKKKKEHS